MHGGASPQVKRKAQERLALEVARAEVATLGLPVDIDPTQALIDEICRTAGHVAWLAEVVASLDRDQVTRGVAKITDRAGERTTEVRSEVNIWVRLYQEERAHLARVAKAAIDAGVAERHVQIVERQAVMLAEVVRRILVDLGHNPDDAKVRERVRLRLVEGGAVPGAP